MLAEYTMPTDDGAKNLARSALDFAPRDPLANWLFVSAENNLASKNTLEMAVNLAPYDYRWWIELGRKQAGAPEAAEKALQKTVELAPEYTFPRWQLGISICAKTALTTLSAN